MQTPRTFQEERVQSPVDIIKTWQCEREGSLQEELMINLQAFWRYAYHLTGAPENYTELVGSSDLSLALVDS